MFECRTFITVKEICQVLSVSESKSYAIVRDLNKELSDKGYMVIPGRVTIMDNTVPALSGPLRGIVQKFVADAENTGNVDIAFDYMKESVDNRQLQTIIINLMNCMHYQANYEEVLVQMMGQIAAGLSAREDRKNILFSSKLTLVVISIMQVIIVWIIGAGLGIDVKQILTGNAFGQLLLLVTGLLYLMVGVKMFGTDR